jgi:hypothetical protein
MNKFSFFVLLIFCTLHTKGQENGTGDTAVNKHFLKQKINCEYEKKDTIKLFLNDSNYYIQKDIGQIFQEFDNKVGYFAYFRSTTAMEFVLKDSLPDGFYCLYNLPSKSAKKEKALCKYLVVAGEYRNGLKQGRFIFQENVDLPEGYRSDKEIYFYKEISFINDTVDGAIKEYDGDLLTYAAEYKMWKKNGFCYFWNNGSPAILLFEDGELVDQTQF